MISADSLEQLCAAVSGWRRAGDDVAFVPTMGNLHDGHLALLAQAKHQARRTVVSIFVNPTQFGPGEDYESYPRTREADLARLESAGCDLVWLPEVERMYPLDSPFMVQVPDSLSNRLCGASRPGHFDGVASVVLRLFNQVQPDVAVFGEKDYQQLVIIRRMVEDLSLGIHIDGLPTVREADGLAMSSRNAYLDADERSRAPVLYRVLTEMARALGQGADFKALRAASLARLEAAGFRPDYLEWCSADHLAEAQPGQPSRLFAAAWLGKARLIDNVGVGVEV
jgi:pantoate--beta-alanine ligase